MTLLAPSVLSKNAWRRLERKAVREHERELLLRVREFSASQPSVLGATGSWMRGALSLQLPGRRLLLGGVAPRAAWSVLATGHSPTQFRLLGGGRYGRLWWVSCGADREQIVVASHLQLLNDPGHPQRAELGPPVLSGAC